MSNVKTLCFVDIISPTKNPIIKHCQSLYTVAHCILGTAYTHAYTRIVFNNVYSVYSTMFKTYYQKKHPLFHPYHTLPKYQVLSRFPYLPFFLDNYFLFLFFFFNHRDVYHNLPNPLQNPKTPPSETLTYYTSRSKFDSKPPQPSSTHPRLQHLKY